MPLDHWNRHAQQWQHVGAPLRPAAEDVAHLEGVVDALPTGDGFTVLLGVTPEIASMRWPDWTRLVAVDRCMGMIRGVWPGEASDSAVAVCGDWTALPVAEGSCELVIGDGCFTLLSYPSLYDQVLSAAHTALRPGGVFIMRYFCRPEHAEPLEAVVADLHQGRIGNFHILKWRLAMSLHGTIEEGVPVGAVWRAFDDAVDDREALVAELGWPRAGVDTIDAYRDVDTPYTFPTLSEVRALTEQWFEEIEVQIPDYELGDRCPTVVYRRRGA